jgi:hypothetical protein
MSSRIIWLHMVGVLLMALAACTNPCPTDNEIRWCPDPDHQDGGYTKCCPITDPPTPCECDPAVDSAALMSLKSWPKPDLALTTLEGPVDHGLSTLRVAAGGDSFEVHVTGKVAIRGGICPDPNKPCPLEVLLLELEPVDQPFTSQGGRSVDDLVARNTNSWTGTKQPGGHIDLDATARLAVQARIVGEGAGGRITHPGSYFTGRFLTNQLRDTGGAVVTNNRIDIKGDFTDSDANISFEISFWLTNCEPWVAPKAECRPGIETSDPGSVHLLSSFGLLQNLQASADLCEAMKAGNPADVCQAGQTGDDILSTYFGCQKPELPDESNLVEIAKRLTFRWSDGGNRTLATSYETVLHTTPPTPLTLSVTNEWGRTVSGRIPMLQCLRQVPLEAGACARYFIANSHQPSPSWCPSGGFLTGLDLDGGASIPPLDGPVVGQAQCCAPDRAGTPAWQGCGWHEVGAAASHGAGGDWGLTINGTKTYAKDSACSTAIDPLRTLKDP